ncbi:MAG: hypothetical protein V3V31_07765 [Methylococcales bacterium]
MAQNFRLPSRRGNRRIAGYVTVATTTKASKKAIKLFIFHSLEPVQDFDQGMQRKAKVVEKAQYTGCM